MLNLSNPFAFVNFCFAASLISHTVLQAPFFFFTTVSLSSS